MYCSRKGGRNAVRVGQNHFLENKVVIIIILGMEPKNQVNRATRSGIMAFFQWQSKMKEATKSIVSRSILCLSCVYFKDGKFPKRKYVVDNLKVETFSFRARSYAIELAGVKRHIFYPLCTSFIWTLWKHGFQIFFERRMCSSSYKSLRDIHSSPSIHFAPLFAQKPISPFH